MNKISEKLSDAMGNELQHILEYWSKNTIDKENDGFVGERNFSNELVPNATKGIILNSRILWSFSAASNHYKSDTYKHICERSYDYLQTFFKDEKYGGVYWELCSKGKPINKRKQVYAQAFMIYALSEYYLFSKNNEALEWAIEIYELIEKHANDTEYKGYIEAFQEDWSAIEDMRLSDKDENEAKTMNTHLHVLEAYTNLYRVYKNDALKDNLTALIQLFFDKFLTSEGHLKLFFDEKWNSKSNVISYGHDIETAWLLIKAATILNEEKLIKKTKEMAIIIADTFIKEGIDLNGGVIHKFNPDTNKMDYDKHWWPQAEAIVGLKYTFNITKNQKYLEVAEQIWNFTNNHIVDHKNGEWFWSVDKNEKPNTSDYKMGMWKAPYHNSRACIILNS